MAVKKFRVFFKYNARYETKSVDVVGDFNQWKPGAAKLSDTDNDNVWDGYIDLPAGEYEYKFLIDGCDYKLDPNSSSIVPRDGIENSVLSVGISTVINDAVHYPDNTDAFLENTLFLKASINKNIYCDAKLILVINDSPRAIRGYSLYWDDNYLYYFFKFQNDFCVENCLYYFEIEKIDGGFNYFGSNGIVDSEWEVNSFEFKESINQPFTTPDWVNDSIFYQIFPDRFNHGDKTMNRENVQPPHTIPGSKSFYGGDLEGVIQKIDYLKELGINAIYFNPIFEAPSPHKYDISDYNKIDPHFGTIETFDKMVHSLKKNSINFILDGVFNHTGTGFFAFKDIEKNGSDSKFINWYFIKKFPLFEDGKPNYECWWNFKDLPKLNTSNPDVKKYLMDCALFWIKKGASGWRLDVPNEVDHHFWKDFRKTLKSIAPDSYILGEIWQNAKPWLMGDEFDAVMNYRFRDACINFFVYRRCTAEEFIQMIGKQISDYPMQANFALLNLLSSHDTARFFTVVEKDITKLKLALSFQFTYLGVPSIYYGEEIGMEGGRDPDNRRFMIWDKKEWNTEVFNLYKSLIKIRNDNEILKKGDFRFIYARNMIIGFERFIEDNKLVIFINNSDKSLQIDVTQILGNGDFIDISKNHPLKRKKAYRLYANDFVILKKIKSR